MGPPRQGYGERSELLVCLTDRELGELWRRLLKLTGPRDHWQEMWPALLTEFRARFWERAEQLCAVPPRY